MTTIVMLPTPPAAAASTERTGGPARRGDDAFAATLDRAVSRDRDRGRPAEASRDDADPVGSSRRTVSVEQIVQTAAGILARSRSGDASSDASCPADGQPAEGTDASAGAPDATADGTTVAGVVAGALAAAGLTPVDGSTPGAGTAAGAPAAPAGPGLADVIDLAARRAAVAGARSEGSVPTQASGTSLLAGGADVPATAAVVGAAVNVSGSSAASAASAASASSTAPTASAATATTATAGGAAADADPLTAVIDAVPTATDGSPADDTSTGSTGAQGGGGSSTSGSSTDGFADGAGRGQHQGLPGGTFVAETGPAAAATTAQTATAHAPALADAPVPGIAPTSPTAGLSATSAGTSAGTAPVMSAGAPVDVPQLAEQLGARLTTLKTMPAGEHVMTLRVDPESIGPVRVVAHIGVGGVRIELVGVTEQAREALRSALPELRRDLAAAGLPAELDLGSESSGFGTTPQRDLDRDGRQGRGASPAAAAAATSQPTPSQPAPVRAGLDLLV